MLKNGSILVGYISQSDLKHALEALQLETGATTVVFHNLSSTTQSNAPDGSPAITSPVFQNTGNGVCDLSQWVDKAPLCIASSASCEMVVELFMKLGIRSLVVTRDGMYIGVIHKKQMLAFINDQ